MSSRPPLGEHRYAVTATWTGNTGPGTTGYRDYARTVTLSSAGRADLPVSADPSFRGDRSLWNPEDLLLGALAECHLLSYLHACTAAGVVVVSYTDDAQALMRQDGPGGAFVEAVLRPRVEVADEAMIPAAIGAHDQAHAWCFIASSVNFPVRHEPVVTAMAGPDARG